MSAGQDLILQILKEECNGKATAEAIVAKAAKYYPHYKYLEVKKQVYRKLRGLENWQRVEKDAKQNPFVYTALE